MTTECRNFDDHLLDYLYEELEPRAQAELRAHVEGCERCRGEVESFGRVRSAVKSQVVMSEPPAAVSAKLLYQAAQQAPRGGVIVPLFRRVARHPVYAMAASFLVVGGLAGALWNSAGHKAMMADSPPPAAATATAAPKIALPAAPAVAANAPAPALQEAQRPVGAPAQLAESNGRATVGGLLEANKADKADKADNAKAPAPKPSALAWRAAKSVGADGLDLREAEGYASPSAHGGAASGKNGFGTSGGGRPAMLGAGRALSAAPPQAPLGDVMAERAAAPAAPPAPAVAPKEIAAAKAAPQSLDDVTQEETRRVMDGNMREVRRGEIDGKLARQQARSLPAPSTAPQPQAIASTIAPRDEPQLADVEQKLKRLDQQAAASDCARADETYRQILEHFPDRLTPQARFDHARCQRVRGQFREARGELERLLVEAPGLRVKVQGELKTLAIDEQAQHQALESQQQPAPARAKKTAAPAKPKPPAAEQNADPPAL